jgi:hypothetical protein
MPEIIVGASHNYGRLVADAEKSLSHSFIIHSCLLKTRGKDLAHRHRKRLLPYAQEVDQRIEINL